jgi:hypothetical protein
MQAEDASTAPAGSLYVTEAEIAHRLGVGVKTWRATAHVLEKSGLPQGDPLFCGRRYWPAVRAFLDGWNGMGEQSSPSHDATQEKWDEYNRKPRTKAPTS